MHKSRLLNETSFLLVISLLLLVSQGFSYLFIDRRFIHWCQLFTAYKAKLDFPSYSISFMCLFT